MTDHPSHREQLVETNDAGLCFETTRVNHHAMTFDGPSHDFDAIKVPTLVVYGDHDPVPHGHALHDAIPGATLLPLGVGHDLPKPLWDVFVPALLQHTEGGRA